MTQVDVSLDGVALSTAVPEAYVLDVRRPLVGARRFEEITVPGRAGSWKFPEEPGDRTIEVVVDLLAGTNADRRASVRALADWADLGAAARLIFDDETDRFHEAVLASAPDVIERLVHGSTTLAFSALPYAYAVTASTEALSAATNPASASFSIPDTVYAEPVIELTPTGGRIAAFVLTVNGSALSWGALSIPRLGAPTIQEDEVPATSPLGGALSSFTGGGTSGYAVYADGYRYDGYGWLPVLFAGETLTISSLSDTVTRGASVDVNLTGAFDPDDVAMTDVSGTFPLLLPGSNTWSLSWEGTATSVSLDLSWRERFR